MKTIKGKMVYCSPRTTRVRVETMILCASAPATGRSGNGSLESISKNTGSW